MNVSEKMEHFDVAIIGLGPAGSALARKLAGKMQVIALDKKHQHGTEGFSKPCGGLLAPDAQRSFIRDGLTLPVDVIANPQIFSVKTVDVAASLTRNYQRSYININRHAFDLWMKSLIPASVEVYHDSLCRKIWREDDKWHVIFRADGWEQHITARYLVGADGAIRAVLPPFTTGVLTGDIRAHSGLTPYGRWGDWPAVGLSVLLLLIGLRRRD